MQRAFNKMPPDEVWISCQGEDEQFCKMLTIEEYMNRLDQNKRPFIRYTNEAAEKARFEEILEEVHTRDQRIKNQFITKYRKVGARRRSTASQGLSYHRQEVFVVSAMSSDAVQEDKLKKHAWSTQLKHRVLSKYDA